MFLLGYCLSQARRVTSDVVNHVGKLGSDESKKSRVIHKALFNFYLILYAVLIIAAKAIEIIHTDLFVAVLIAIYTGLGIKLTADIKDKGKEEKV